MYLVPLFWGEGEYKFSICMKSRYQLMDVIFCEKRRNHKSTYAASSTKYVGLLWPYPIFVEMTGSLRLVSCVARYTPNDASSRSCRDFDFNFDVAAIVKVESAIGNITSLGKIDHVVGCILSWLLESKSRLSRHEPRVVGCPSEDMTEVEGHVG